MLLAESLLGTSSTAATYIEDVFSTYLYTGNGSTQTITNGIDLSTKGGLVWIKNRATDKHCLYDTARGALKVLSSNAGNAEQVAISGRDLTGFTASGFSLGPNYTAAVNENTANHTSWTFRKQAKFFDVVTYTGNATARTISHNLGSAPGCIIVKRTSALDDWYVYHRSLTSAAYSLILNTTGGQTLDTLTWNNTAPTSTSFSVGGSGAATNVSGETYVAYLFAHDAGGFGASGTDNVISCGSYTGDGTDGQFVNVGFEVQWLLVKRTNAVGDWFLVDVMRGALANGAYPCANLYPNLSNAETLAGTFGPDPRGFRISASTSTNASGSPFIYIAIRRGPMKTPTSGTSVFSPNTSSAASGTKITTNFPVDAQLGSDLVGTSNRVFVDRLRGISTNATGAGQTLLTNSTGAEATGTGSSLFWDNTGFQMNANFGGAAAVFWNFRRAPGFFDVVCYTGDGTTRTIKHNLGVVPEMIIVKVRSGGNESWITYVAPLGNTGSLFLNMNDLFNTGSLGSIWNNTNPTATEFTVVNKNQSNASGYKYVAYLFASCPGVSKVGSYTGTGTTQQINCGFTGGARFVLIKRTDNLGDWYLWDSARGIVAGNDPYILINSNVAEVTGTDYIDTYAAGFEISSTAPAAINASGGSFIFLAIA